jgi:hypothetical protein
MTSHLPRDFLVMLKVLTVLTKVSGSYSGSHSISILRAWLSELNPEFEPELDPDPEHSLTQDPHPGGNP